MEKMYWFFETDTGFKMTNDAAYAARLNARGLVFYNEVMAVTEALEVLQAMQGIDAVLNPPIDGTVNLDEVVATAFVDRWPSM